MSAMAASIVGRSSTRGDLQNKGNRLHVMLVSQSFLPPNSSWVFIYPGREADIYGNLPSFHVCPTQIHHLSLDGKLLRVSCVHDILKRCPTCTMDTLAEKEALRFKPEAPRVIVTVGKARLAFIDCISWFMDPRVVLEVPPWPRVVEVLNHIDYQHNVLDYITAMEESGLAD